MNIHTDHSIAIGHRKGKAIGILATLESIGLPKTQLVNLTYYHSITGGTITISDSRGADLVTLGNLAQGLMDCCARRLPIYILKPNGEDIELIISPPPESPSAARSVE